MNLILVMLCLNTSHDIDSLKALLAKKPVLATALELNDRYRRAAQFDSANMILKAFETHSNIEEKEIILYAIADNDFFSGMLTDARAGYLAMVVRFSKSDFANDALERLYLIEIARKDTVQLKRLARFICLYETGQFDAAVDSLKGLLDSGAGEYAYLYTALAYMEKKEFTLALGALSELGKKYPAHRLHRATLLLARVYIELGDKREARKTLETLVVKEPNSVYLIPAREMLKELGNK